MSFKTFLTQLADSAAALGTLEVKTVVKGGADGDKAIVTRIDLLGSDITNEMDVTFVNGDFVTVRDFHQQQVVKAEGLFNSLLAFIADAFEKFSALAEEDADET